MECASQASSHLVHHVAEDPDGAGGVERSRRVGIEKGLLRSGRRTDPLQPMLLFVARTIPVDARAACGRQVDARYQRHEGGRTVVFVEAREEVAIGMFESCLGRQSPPSDGASGVATMSERRRRKASSARIRPAAPRTDTRRLVRNDPQHPTVSECRSAIDGRDEEFEMSRQPQIVVGDVRDNRAAGTPQTFFVRPGLRPHSLGQVDPLNTWIAE